MIAADVSTGFGVGGVCVFMVLQKKLPSSHIALNWETVTMKTYGKPYRKGVQI